MKLFLQCTIDDSHFTGSVRQLVLRFLDICEGRSKHPAQAAEARLREKAWNAYKRGEKSFTDYGFHNSDNELVPIYVFARGELSEHQKQKLAACIL